MNASSLSHTQTASSANRQLAQALQNSASSSQSGEDQRRLSGGRPQQDEVQISRASQQALDAEQRPDQNAARKAEQQQAQVRQLTPQQEQQVQDMKLRDQEVRVHEQAHKSAGGRYAGAISLSYQTGPDGKRYAVAGEVPISTGEERSPQATIKKMQTVRRAALAPAQPSSADRAIAAQAAQTQNQAQVELREILQAERQGQMENDSATVVAATDASADENQSQDPLVSGASIIDLTA